ncbi:MAG TPA: FliH/SctL family protein [Desulfuromonadales bacterium]|nr:FliH/SctL family protein [Desulfuromonadales bacterium]
MSLSRIVRGNGDESKPVMFYDFDRPFEVETDAAPFTETAGAPGGATAKGEASAGAPEPAPNLDALREDAFASGRQEGLAIAEQQLGSTTRALAAALQDISRLRQSLLTNSTDDMVRLVMAVAEQVIQTVVTEKETVVLDVLKNALQAAVKADEFHIRVHPDDLTAVTEHQPLFLASVSGLKNITFEGDPSIARGGCFIESALGEVDATIETQLEEIRRHLAQAIQVGTNEGAG